MVLVNAWKLHPRKQQRHIPKYIPGKFALIFLKPFIQLSSTFTHCICLQRPTIVARKKISSYENCEQKWWEEDKWQAWKKKHYKKNYQRSFDFPALINAHKYDLYEMSFSRKNQNISYSLWIEFFSFLTVALSQLWSAHWSHNGEDNITMLPSFGIPAHDLFPMLV